MYETNSGLFSIEFFCNLCGSDNSSLYFDKNRNRLIIKCECGTTDYIELEDISDSFSEFII